MTEKNRQDLSRRALLAAGIGTAGVLLTPSLAHAAGGEQGGVMPLAMTSQGTIGGTPLYYEPTQARATFSTGSTAQVQHVQAVCRYIWGHATDLDGIWGPQTQSHSTAVLRRIGYATGTIANDGINWRAFNRYSVLQGSGRESF